jgi:hypothetical protein
MAFDQKNSIKEVLFYFSFLMVLVYIGIGLMFMFSNFLSEMVRDNRAVIGGIFIIYGVFRLYMLIRLKRARDKYRSQENEKQL